MFKRFSISVFLLFVATTVLADTITWYKVNRPPWFTKEQDGYADHMQTSYEALLTEYAHQSKQMNLARLFAEMAKGGQFCIAALGKIPHMNQDVYLSKTTYRLPAPKIFMKSHTFVRLGQPRSISIKALADQEEYRLALVGGVQHLPLNPNDYKHSAHVSVISNDFPIVSIMRMIDVGRVEWSADFPHMIQWGSESGNIPISGSFNTIDIAEFEGGGDIEAGIACSKNAWGKTVIDKLNALVDKDTLRKNIDIVSRWMPPGALTDEFYALNEDLLGQ